MTHRPAALTLIALSAVAVAACGSSVGSPAATAAVPAATAAAPVATAAPVASEAPAGRDYGTTAPAPATTPAAPAAGAPAAVAIANFAFAPADLTVATGTTVTWTNADGAPHSIKSSDGGFASGGALSKGASYTVTFSTAGTFAYVCGIHPSMRGTITVTP